MNNEQNLLIAEFMGMKFNKARKCYHTPSFGVDVNGCKIEDLGFSNSWDWIMAVVQKMNRTDYWAEFLLNLSLWPRSVSTDQQRVALRVS